MSAPRRKGLGRGLDALLGAEPPPPPSAPASPEKLAVDRLEPNRLQPRTHFDEESLAELSASIRAQGVVQPIVVTPGENGRYAIVAGERRWRAARLAGLAEVPVVVRQVGSDRELLELALVENLQRADLDPIEEAEAFRQLAEAFGLSQEEIATRVGRSRPAVTNALRLLRLPPPVQALLRDGRLTPGQARPLLALPDAERQIALAERAVAEGLTARDLEALTAAVEEPPALPRATPEPDVHTRDAVERLTQALQTRVDIRRRRRGGVVQIFFHSEDELIRLYDRLIHGSD